MSDLPTITTAEDFIALYGYPPQEYFDRTVRGDAKGANIAVYEAKIAAWKAELALVPDPESIPAMVEDKNGSPVKDPKTGLSLRPIRHGFTHQGAIEKIAELETEIDAYKGLIQAAKGRQAGAKAFLAGDIPDYLPFLGGQGRTLNDLGLIDTTRVPADEG